MVGGHPSESPPLPGSGGGRRGRAVTAPRPSLTLFLELIKALLNEPSSVKADEVSGRGALPGEGVQR